MKNEIPDPLLFPGTVSFAIAPVSDTDVATPVRRLAEIPGEGDLGRGATGSGRRPRAERFPGRRPIRHGR